MYVCILKALSLLKIETMVNLNTNTLILFLMFYHISTVDILFLEKNRSKMYL